MNYEREKAFNVILTQLMSDDQEALKRAYVEAATEHDPGLRELAKTYLSDLAGKQEVGSFFQQSINKVLKTGSLDRSNAIEIHANAALEEGTQVGNYYVESVLGEGGMGTVYKVRHHWEGAPAALKVVRVTTPQAIGQFAEERCILARLTHPNIAHFLDSGTLQDGRAWLALEYVEGVSLNDYCEQQQPTLKERLRIFMEICRAVDHAHERGILHCDLKPVNIMVTPCGHVKLLDFGIARVVDHQESDPYQLMTPEYASPEQINCKPLSTASDVYSLGILLYQLLTGKRPYSFSSRNPRHIQEVVNGAIISRPSRTGETDYQNTRNLRGDLDTIILKALARDQKQRYVDAGELLDDLERYLAGKPVLARSSSCVYVTRKFIARNLWPASLAAACMLLMVMGFSMFNHDPCDHESHAHHPHELYMEWLANDDMLDDDINLIASDPGAMEGDNYQLADND